jgi:hypothetical protein
MPQVMDTLGSAAFSRAVQALDIKTGALVCLKIIKVSGLCRRPACRCWHALPWSISMVALPSGGTTAALKLPQGSPVG